MRFIPMPVIVPDAESWGCEDGERSYAISFDHKHPGAGYRASWKMIGDRKRHDIGSFSSLAKAEGACRAVQSARAH